MGEGEGGEKEMEGMGSEWEGKEGGEGRDEEPLGGKGRDRGEERVRKEGGGGDGERAGSILCHGAKFSNFGRAPCTARNSAMHCPNFLGARRALPEISSHPGWIFGMILGIRSVVPEFRARICCGSKNANTLKENTDFLIG